MRLALQLALWAIGFLLQILLIQSFLRGAYRRYPLPFAYTVILLLITVGEVAAYPSWGSRGLVHSWYLYYWLNDALMQALLYAVVISLIYKAMEQAEARAAMRRTLVAGAGLLFALLFLVHSGPFRQLSAWMTLVSRDLSFAAAILDLLLWSKLIAAKRKDHQLLLLSGGLGIQFTAAAIGQSVRDLAQKPFSRSFAMVLMGGLLVVAGNLVMSYIWWQAIRRPPAVDHPTS